MKALKIVVAFILLLSCSVPQAGAKQHMFAEIPFDIKADEFVELAKENWNFEFHQSFPWDGVPGYWAYSNDLVLYGLPTTRIDVKMRKDQEGAERLDSILISFEEDLINLKDKYPYKKVAEKFANVYTGMLDDYGKETEAFWGGSNLNDSPSDYVLIKDVLSEITAEKLNELASKYTILAVKVAFDNVSLVCVVDKESSTPTSSLAMTFKR